MHIQVTRIEYGKDETSATVDFLISDDEGNLQINAHITEKCDTEARHPSIIARQAARKLHKFLNEAAGKLDRELVDMNTSDRWNL